MKKITGKRILGLLLISTTIAIVGVTLIHKSTEKLFGGTLLIIGMTLFASFFIEHVIVALKKEKRPLFLRKNDILLSILVTMLRVLVCNFLFILGLAIVAISGNTFATTDYLLLFVTLVWAQICGGFIHHLWRIILIYNSMYNPEIDIGEDVR